MKNLRPFLFATLCSVALFFVGCGKKESGQEGAGKTASDQTAAKSGGESTGASTAASGRAVEITANDTMKFSITEIRAKPGESLSVTLSNVGTMPKFSMGHNWILLKSASVVDAFIAEAPQAATTDYIPQSKKDDILAHTKLLGPKEKDTVTFQAPKEPGKYPFLCSFPGHVQVGMRGDLIVE
jgi:azurin